MKSKYFFFKSWIKCWWLKHYIAHLYDGVDDDDIEELNNKTSSDSFSQLLRGLRQAGLLGNF